MSLVSSAFMVSLFWIGLCIGRISISLCYRGLKGERLILFLTLPCTVSIFSAVVSNNFIRSLTSFFIVELGYSAICPLVMSLVGKYFPNEQSVAIGIVSTGGGIGAFVFPFVMSALFNDYPCPHGNFICSLLYKCIKRSKKLKLYLLI